jgi:hypothetical protein
MTQLNEIIGSIVSSLADARMMSDVQTAKIAQAYSEHHLLQHFSVPRMRIEDIELTIPLAVESGKEKVKTTYEPLDTRQFNSIVYKDILTSLGLSKLPARLSRSIQQEISSQTKVLESEVGNALNLTPLKSFSANIVRYCIAAASEFSLVNEENLNSSEISGNLEALLNSQFKIIREERTLDTLDVIIEAHRLREFKPESIIQIKLKLSESGMEWNTFENTEGRVERQLLAE